VKTSTNTNIRLLVLLGTAAFFAGANTFGSAQSKLGVSTDAVNPFDCGGGKDVRKLAEALTAAKGMLG